MRSRKELDMLKMRIGCHAGNRNKMNQGFRLSFCFALFCLCLSAQNPSATATGSISDPSGAAVAGAAVTLTGVDTGVALKAETNDAGIYRISGLNPGNYKISVSREGFQSLTQDRIEIHVGETATRNYVLAIGSVKETVTVEESAVNLDTASTTVGQ